MLNCDRFERGLAKSRRKVSLFEETFFLLTSNFIEDAGNEIISEQDDDPVPVSSGRDIERDRTINNANDICESNVIGDATQNHGKFDEKFGALDVNTFKPTYIIGEWEDERRERRVTIIILMPSGPFKTLRDQDLKVSEDGF